MVTVYYITLLRRNCTSKIIQKCVSLWIHFACTLQMDQNQEAQIFKHIRWCFENDKRLYALLIRHYMKDVGQQIFDVIQKVFLRFEQLVNNSQQSPWDFCTNYIRPKLVRNYKVPATYEFTRRGTAVEQAWNLAKFYSPTSLQHSDQNIDLQGLLEILINFKEFSTTIEASARAIRDSRNKYYAHIRADNFECELTGSDWKKFVKEYKTLRRLLRKVNPSIIVP